MSNQDLFLAVPIGITLDDMTDILQLAPPQGWKNSIGRVSNVHFYFNAQPKFQEKINYPGEWGQRLKMSCSKGIDLEEVRLALAVYLYRQLVKTYPGNYICYDSYPTTFFYAMGTVLVKNSALTRGFTFRHDFARVLPMVCAPREEIDAVLLSLKSGT